MIDIGSGFIKAVSNGTKSLVEGTIKSWKFIVLDAAIMSLIALFAVCPIDIPNINDLYVMLRAFGASFVLEVAVERGLKKKIE